MLDIIIRMILSFVYILGIYVISVIIEVNVEQLLLVTILLFLIEMDWEK